MGKERLGKDSIAADNGHCPMISTCSANAYTVRKTSSEFPQGDPAGSSNATAFNYSTTSSTHTKFTSNDIMFSESINPSINGGMFHVLNYRSTIGTSEVDEGSQQLIADT